MRRIAAVTMTAAALVAGVGAFATPAEAAAAKSFKTWDQVKGTKTWGTWSRTDGGTTVKFKLRDQARNGRTACVVFAFIEGNKRKIQPIYLVIKPGNRRYDGTGTLTTSEYSPYNDHLYVKECNMSTRTGKIKYPKKWKKLF